MNPPNVISNAQRGPPRSAWRRLRGRARAALIGGLIVSVGAAASCLLAAEWRSNQLSANRTSFRSTASDLSSSLGSKLEASFAVTRTMRAIATMEPHAGDTGSGSGIRSCSAKAVGKDGYVLFESAMQTAARDRMHLELDLASALADDQLFLEYQPVLSLENEQVVGVEALLRWRHPTRGVIPPDMFIPIAEGNALIVPIGRWVLDQACAQASAWRRRGHALTMSVNVSGRQLERTEFIGELRNALHDSGLEPDRRRRLWHRV